GERSRIRGRRISATHGICAESAVLRKVTLRLAAKLVAMIGGREIPQRAAVFEREFLLPRLGPVLEIGQDVISLNSNSVTVPAEPAHFRTLIRPPAVPFGIDCVFFRKIDGIASGLQNQNRRTDLARSCVCLLLRGKSRLDEWLRRHDLQWRAAVLILPRKD